jgi:hypothetical protein
MIAGQPRWRISKKICGPPRDTVPRRPAVNHPATRPGDSFLVTNKVMITASNL